MQDHVVRFCWEEFQSIQTRHNRNMPRNASNTVDIGTLQSEVSSSVSRAQDLVIVQGTGRLVVVVTERI